MNPLKNTKFIVGSGLRSTSIDGKRVKCNLFKRSSGQTINGDVNGAYNIVAKAVPNAFAEERAGLALVPHSLVKEQTLQGGWNKF